MLPEYFEFSLPTKVVYGVGILKNIKDSVAHFGERKAILVTDEVLNKVGLVKQVKAGFKNTSIKIAAVFDQVPPNSTIDTVEACAKLGKSKNCDLVIALGGGSVIDTAKVCNILMAKGGKIHDYMGAYTLGDAELHPTIFIPTTAGTGSEVTKVAVIADIKNDVKLPFSETQFLPDLAVLDPEVTLSMPPKLTAMTGMDALTHAIEAYVDKEWSPVSDALALHAVKLINQHLLVACANPKDVEARGGMLVASFIAGVAFSHSMVGMVHGIAHALGGVYHIPHGLANALVLPEVMEYNLEARLDRYADIAEAMGITFPALVHDSQNILEFLRLPVPQKVIDRLGFIDDWFRLCLAKASVEKVRKLNRQLAYLTKMPLNLKEAGVTDDLAKLDQVAKTAMEDGAMLYNPKEVEVKAVTKILKRIHKTRVKPLTVSPEDLNPAVARQKQKELKDIFKDTEMIYEVLGDFYESLKADPELSGPLKQSKLCVQFVYQHPEATITLNAKGPEVEITHGEFKGTPDVVFTLNADVAHYFWHGKINLLSAITRRQVMAKGNVPKAVKLLPILKPAYTLYPQFLRNKGLEHLIVR